MITRILIIGLNLIIFFLVLAAAIYIEPHIRGESDDIKEIVTWLDTTAVCVLIVSGMLQDSAKILKIIINPNGTDTGDFEYKWVIYALPTLICSVILYKIA